MSTTTTSTGPATSNDREGLLRRILTPKPHFKLSARGDACRAEAELFVTEKFQAAWQARVTTYLPWLLSLHCLGHCSAVAGIRPAGHERLFLERYLDGSAEQVLGNTLKTQIPRREIVEIGNLVASQRGASHLLFLVVSAALHRAGYRWIVFTATRALRNNLGKLGFPLHELAPALAECLEPAALADWGSYYQSAPLVVAGSLDDAMTIIQGRPLLRRGLRLYRNPINEIAARLKDGWI